LSLEECDASSFLMDIFLEVSQDLMSGEVSLVQSPLMKLVQALLGGMLLKLLTDMVHTLLVEKHLTLLR
jgi:hypothetical protein